MQETKTWLTTTTCGRFAPLAVKEPCSRRVKAETLALAGAGFAMRLTGTVPGN